MNQTPRKAGNWLNEEISSGKSFDATIVPLPAVPRRFFAAGIFECVCKRRLCGIENQCLAVSKRDFLGLPSGALVILPGIIPFRCPFLVEPVKIRFVIGYPFFNGLPRWLDGLHGFDVEGRRRWPGKMDDAFPEAVEPEEEFDFALAHDLADGFHGALAAGALERVAAPDFEDKVAPEGSHVAGSAFGRGGDEEELEGLGLIGRGLCFHRAADVCAAARGDASGFVGIDAVVSDGLLTLGR